MRVTLQYVEEMRTSWQKDPASVHPTWQEYFAKGGSAVAETKSDTPASVEEVNQHCSDHIKMLLLVRSHQIRGHYMVKLDPLGINDGNLHIDKMEYRGGEDQANEVPRLLDYKTYGFTEADLDRKFFLNAGVGGGKGGLIGSGQRMTLREIVDIMKSAYCDTVGVEFTHIASMEQQNWIRSKFEHQRKFVYDEAATLRLLDRLIYAVTFESFLATKYNTTKRFGLEGVDALIPGMKVHPRSPQHDTFNPKNSNPQSSILNPQSSILNTQSSILSPQSSVLNPQNATLNPKPCQHSRS